MKQQGSVVIVGVVVWRSSCLACIVHPMPPAGVKILFLLGWMDVVVARSRQVVVLAM